MLDKWAPGAPLRAHTSLDCKSWGLYGPVCWGWPILDAAETWAWPASMMSLGTACKDVRALLLATVLLKWWKCSSRVGVWCLTWQVEPRETPCFEAKAWGRKAGETETTVSRGSLHRVGSNLISTLLGGQRPRKLRMWCGFFCRDCAFVQWAHIQNMVILLRNNQAVNMMLGKCRCYATEWLMRCDGKGRNNRLPFSKAICMTCLNFILNTGHDGAHVKYKN